MDAHLTTLRQSPSTERVRVAGVAYVASIGLVAACGVTLLWRRLDGVLVNPLDFDTSLAVSTLLIVACLAIRQAAIAWQPDASPQARCGLAVTPFAITSLIIGCLSLGSSSTIGLTVLWLPVGLTAAVCLAISWSNGRLPGLLAIRSGRFSRNQTKRSQRIIRVDSTHAGTTNSVPSPHFPPERVSQQMTRSLTEEGHDQCQGWIRADFDEGQRQQVVHLSFCPPFQTLPELTTTLADAPTIEIKHAQLMPYGARVELKRARSAKEPAATLLRFSAVEMRAAG